MVRLLIALSVGLALPAANALAGDAPRMRIITVRGPVLSPHKMFLGRDEAFLAVPIEKDDERRPGPDRALRGVEWWLFRTFDMRSHHRGTETQPGREVGHRLPGRSRWGHGALPFSCPDGLRMPWNSGRYLLQATHPDRGRATLKLTMASLLLVGYDADLSETSYVARFSVALCDPDLTRDTVPIEIRTVNARGRLLDRLATVRLVRQAPAYRTPHEIRISSRAPARALDAPPDDGRRERPLRIEPDARLQLEIQDRVFDFPLPLEEGLLVRRSHKIPAGRESPTRPIGDTSLLTGRRLRRRPGPPTSSPSRLGRRGSLPPPGRTAGDGPGAIEIVSSAGRGRRVRVWVGEPVTFAARVRPRGLDDLFQPASWLRDTIWTMRHETSPARPRAEAIVSGRSVSVVGRAGPRGLWGDPPSLFRCPDDLPRAWRPGLYWLFAERPGGAAAEVRIDVASFEIVDVTAELRSDLYEATLRFRLTDPTRTGNVIPIAVRIVSARGEVLDAARGVRLSRDTSRRGEYVSDRVQLSSRAPAPTPTDPPTRSRSILRAHPGSFLRVVLDDAIFTYPLPLSAYENLTGRAKGPGASPGR